MRNVFIIGDSISIQYGPYLSKILAGRFGYDRKRGQEQALADLDRAIGSNGGNSSMVREYLITEREKGVRYDILLINCGLHDIKSNPENDEKEVAINEYRKNLQHIAEISMEIARDFMWIRTTDVVDEIHNKPGRSFYRFHSDVVQVNSIADEIFSKLGVPLIDLYRFSKTFSNSAYCDHVHFIEEVRYLQAAYIAGHLDSKFIAI